MTKRTTKRNTKKHRKTYKGGASSICGFSQKDINYTKRLGYTTNDIIKRYHHVKSLLPKSPSVKSYFHNRTRSRSASRHKTKNLSI